MGFPGFPDIEKMKADRDLNGLVNALDFHKKDSNHRFIRTEAAQALWELGFHQQNPALFARAVKPLIGMLKEKDFLIVQTAAGALGGIGDPRAVKPLCSLLKSGQAENWQLRRTVYGALSLIKDEGTLEPLCAALKDAVAWNRAEAAEYLGKKGSPRLVQPLIAALKDADRSVRANAARSLGEIGNAFAVDALMPLLKDGEDSVRKAAAEALGRIGDPRAVAPLIAALKDADKVVRKDAVAALDLIGWKPLTGEDQAWYTIACQDWEQAAALGEPAVGPLVTAIMGWTGPARQRAGQALHSMGWKPVTVEQNACFLIARREWWHCEALGERAVEPLIAALLYETSEEDEHIRSTAAMTLGSLASRSEDAALRSRVVDTLLAALKDGKMSHPEGVVTALGMIGDPRAVEPLIAELENKSNSVWVLVAVVPALARIDDPRVLPALRAALTHTDPNVRQLAEKHLPEYEKKMAPQVEGFDLRSDIERQIERAANAGESLGVEIDHLVDELVQIGRTDGFRSTRPGGKFDESWNHTRARLIGEELDRTGGMDLMKAVYYRVSCLLPGEARSLESAWSYVGEWRA